MSIFHKLHDKLNVSEVAREHAKAELIDQLVHKGKAHVEGIGTWQFQNYQISFTPDKELVTEVRNRYSDALQEADADWKAKHQ